MCSLPLEERAKELMINQVENVVRQNFLEGRAPLKVLLLCSSSALGKCTGGGILRKLPSAAVIRFLGPLARFQPVCNRVADPVSTAAQ